MIDLIKKHKALVLILAVSLFIRVYRLPGYMEFLGDQGRDVLIVRRFLKQGDLMFIGPQTSIGNMYLGPWYYYLIAPSLVLTNFNPVGPAFFNSLIGVASVWLVWLAAKQMFNQKVGLISAVLAAFSPVLIKYSTFSWNPNILPFFSVLSIWFLWRVWQKNDYKSLIWLTISLVMVLNSHYLGLLLFPVVGVIILVKIHKLIKQSKIEETRNFLKFGFWGFGVFLLLMSPLVIFDIKHNFSNYLAFKEFFTVRQTTVDLKFYKGFTDLPVIVNQFLSQFVVNTDQVAWIYLVTILVLIIAGLWKYRKNKSTWLIAGWLVIGLVGLSNYKQHIYAHYYLFLYPSVAILIGLGLSKLNLFGLGASLVIAGIMFANWHGWSSPVNQLKRAKRGAAEICNRVDQQSKFNIVNLASYNDYRALSYRYFLVNNCPKTVLGQTDYPQAEELFVIQEDPEKYPSPVAADIWEIQSGGNWQEKDVWQAYDVKVYRLIKK